MAGLSVSRTIRVAVCGLTSSTFDGLSGQGAGKSCLCNRFVRPNKDDLRMEQIYVLNRSDFASNIINNTHFLYWGEKVLGLQDGQDVVFQIIEHTEFVDDSSLKPFPSTKPYHKRCTQLKLQSGGKVTYIEPDQLALPEQYNDVGSFPDKFLVDGFILCVDVSSSFTEPGSHQKKIFERLLQYLLPTKKPIVVALTKFDQAKESSVASVNEVLAQSKKQLPVVEVSALKGVNVDLCFLVLAHLVDPKKPKTRISSYAEARAILVDRIRKNEVSFQQVLDQKITDFAMSVTTACEAVSGQVEFQLLRELCGIERVQRLVRGKLGYLKRERVEVWHCRYLEALPGMLAILLPELPLTADEESSRQLIKENPKMGDFMVEVQNWREDIGFLKSADGRIPFSLLSEDAGEEILRHHIEWILKSARENATCHDVPQNSSGLTPGAEVDRKEEPGLTEMTQNVAYVITTHPNDAYGQRQLESNHLTSSLSAGIVSIDHPHTHSTDSVDEEGYSTIPVLKSAREKSACQTIHNAPQNASGLTPGGEADRKEEPVLTEMTQNAAYAITTHPNDAYGQGRSESNHLTSDQNMAPHTHSTPAMDSVDEEGYEYIQ